MSSDEPTAQPQPPQPPEPPPQQPEPRAPIRGTGRLVGGVILVVIGVLAFAIGGVLLGFHLGARDDDGFYEIHDTRLGTPTRALVSDSVKVNLGGASIVEDGVLGGLGSRQSRAGGAVVGHGPTATSLPGRRRPQRPT